MKKEQKQALDEAILADIHDPTLSYIVIAVKHKVGQTRVHQLATAHNLNRKRGPKPRLPQEQG